MQKIKTQKGITLIALIITIIVMLILVGVSVTVALNGGLFSTAQKATGDTEVERDKELALSDGRVKVNGVWYDSMEDYVANQPSENQGEGSKDDPVVTVPSTYKTSITGLANTVTFITYENLESQATAEIKEAVDKGKISAVLKETITLNEVSIEALAVIPTGFEVSTEDGEDSISQGLVIYDGTSDSSRNNEFVWVPVTNPASYVEDDFAPLTGNDSTSTYVYDSYQEIQYYYGDALGTINSEETFNATFTYAADKTNVETSIQTYGGFYVGRYETTIEGTTIGVQKGKPVLSVSTLLKTETNETSGQPYSYRWWGLYKAQKDMYIKNSVVGSLMISDKQWNAIMTFTGYGNGRRATNTYTTKPDLSGSAYATDSTKYDVSKNIYDLAGNVTEFTLKANDIYSRIFRGGYSNTGNSPAKYSSYVGPGHDSFSALGSRCALYIK